MDRYWDNQYGLSNHTKMSPTTSPISHQLEGQTREMCAKIGFSPSNDKVLLQSCSSKYLESNRGRMFDIDAYLRFYTIQCTP